MRNRSDRKKPRESLEARPPRDYDEDAAGEGYESYHGRNPVPVAYGILDCSVVEGISKEEIFFSGQEGEPAVGKLHYFHLFP